MPDSIAVSSLFARIASRYDLANRLLSLGVDRWWRRQLVADVRKTRPETILDLATGSGDVAFALSRGLPTTTLVTGVDFSQPMLDEAEIKLRAHADRYPNVSFHSGDGMNLSFPDASFDAVTISFGLRNMANRAGALREMRRVLRPAGHLFILEFSQPQRWFRPIYFFYLRQLLPRLAGIVTGQREAYIYLNETIEEFPNRATLAAEIAAAGFGEVSARGFTFGIVALHQAKK